MPRLRQKHIAGQRRRREVRIHSLGEGESFRSAFSTWGALRRKAAGVHPFPPVVEGAVADSPKLPVAV
jgi:hypothetical protein